MAFKLSKEAILTGSVDQLCLVCESYLHGAREALQHAGSATHIENLARTQYVTKYIQDRVRKVKKWYFCESCNIVLATRTKVRIHVQESQHKENVEINKIERVGDVIVSGNVVIQEEAWHGLINNNTCIICNVTFQNKDDHMRESNHIINLIQSKVSYYGNNIYRKVYGESIQTFQCLTCNKVGTGIKGHFDDATHKKLLRKSDLKHCELNADFNQQAAVRKASPLSVKITDKTDKPNQTLSGKQLNNEFEKITNVEEKVHVEGLENGSKEIYEHEPDIIDFIPKFQLESIDINFESESVVCRKCSVKLELHIESIQHHILEHGSNVKTKASECKPLIFEKNENSDTTDTVRMSPASPDLGQKDTETTKSATPDESDIGELRNNENINICDIKPTLVENNESDETTDSITVHMSPASPDHGQKDTESTKSTTPDESDIGELRNSENINICEIKPTLVENNENDETTDSITVHMSPASPDHGQKDTETTKSTTPDESDIGELRNNENINICEIKPTLVENNENDETTDSIAVHMSPASPDHGQKDTESTKSTTPDESDIGELRNSENINICEIKPTLVEKNDNNETTDSKSLLMSPAFLDHGQKNTESEKTETTNIKSDDNDIGEHTNKEKNKISETKHLLERNKNNKSIDSESLRMCLEFLDHEPQDTEIVDSEPPKTTIQEDSESKYNAIQKIAEEHGLTYNSNGKKVFCGICYKKVPSSVINIKEHLNGEIHKNNVRLCSRPTNQSQTKSDEVAKKTTVKKCDHQRMPTKLFIRVMSLVQSIFARDVIINEKYCINYLSFEFLTMSSPGRLRCHICEVNILTQDLIDHIAKSHSKATTEVPVLINTDSEFIREVRSGQFHCGYCNIIDTWEGMEKHLESSLHKGSKTCADWRLAQYLPAITDHVLIGRLFDNSDLTNVFPIFPNN